MVCECGELRLSTSGGVCGYAVCQALGSQDYTLIQGLPGCGKTATVIHLVKALLARDSTTSVLIASYTNTAVDNVLLKLLAQVRQSHPQGPTDLAHPGARDPCMLALHAGGPTGMGGREWSISRDLKSPPRQPRTVRAHADSLS